MGKWIKENPMTALMALLLLVGMVSIICGYREGFASIITGFFGWMKGDDINNRRRLVELQQQADAAAKGVSAFAADIESSYDTHDAEVVNDVLQAKAICDDMSVDDLIAFGNNYIAGIGRDTAERR